MRTGTVLVFPPVPFRFPETLCIGTSVKTEVGERDTTVDSESKGVDTLPLVGG